MLTKAVKWLALVVVLLALVMSVSVVMAQDDAEPTDEATVESPVVVDVETDGDVVISPDDGEAPTDEESSEEWTVERLTIIGQWGVIIILVLGMIFQRNLVPPDVVKKLAEEIRLAAQKSPSKIDDAAAEVLNTVVLKLLPENVKPMKEISPNDMRGG